MFPLLYPPKAAIEPQIVSLILGVLICPISLLVFGQTTVTQSRSVYILTLATVGAQIHNTDVPLLRICISNTKTVYVKTYRTFCPMIKPMTHLWNATLRKFPLSLDKPHQILNKVWLNQCYPLRRTHRLLRTHLVFFHLTATPGVDNDLVPSFYSSFFRLCCLLVMRRAQTLSASRPDSLISS